MALGPGECSESVEWVVEERLVGDSDDIGEVQWRKGRWQGVVGCRGCLRDLVMRRVGRD